MTGTLVAFFRIEDLQAVAQRLADAGEAKVERDPYRRQGLVVACVVNTRQAFSVFVGGQDVGVMLVEPFLPSAKARCRHYWDEPAGFDLDGETDAIFHMTCGRPKGHEGAHNGFVWRTAVQRKDTTPTASPTEAARP